MLILGINAFHGDSAACIVNNGTLIAAAEEERFRREKHWAGFPSQAIKYCLSEAGVSLGAVDHVAINQNGNAHFLRKIGYTLLHRPDPSFVLDRLRNRKARTSVRELLAREFAGVDFEGQVHAIEHHEAHLYSAFHVSPFKSATVVSIDGFGDFSSAAWGRGEGTHLAIEGRVFFPHSLGVFYQALTQFLGFWNYGDEYKVMGLAPYGKPSYLNQMRDIVQVDQDGTYRLRLSYFNHHRHKIAYEWREGIPTFAQLYTPALENLLGPSRRPEEPLDDRHRDIAHSVQAMFEEAFFKLLRTLHTNHRLDDLAIAGGCGMNSVANGKVRRLTDFRRVYVQSAAGDAGGAIGAAFSVWHRLNGGTERFLMDHAYWGPSYSEAKFALVLGEASARLKQNNCATEYVGGEEELCRRAAGAIADGKVLGWFQGRMEWGPRALGNRSILGDPRRADMKDILNRKIKRRESFRPFAPSVLREAVNEWFEEEDDVPFMMQVFQIRADKRTLIPAVTHVDGSGRLQTVDQVTNPLYWRVIDEFRQLTGVPMVLNTSFNENEPVVCKPEEALDCFLRTNMDVLILGAYVVERR
jgi:carbamoyltransferase